MTTKQIDLHISDLANMGDRFTAAWKAAEANGDIQRDHVTFLSLEAFVSALSPKRLELIRHLHANGPMSVRALSKALKRDYKSVHSDSAILTRAGLIDRSSKDLVCAPWDRVVSELSFAA